jgi:hypothetical protein
MTNSLQGLNYVKNPPLQPAVSGHGPESRSVAFEANFEYTLTPVDMRMEEPDQTRGEDIGRDAR